MVSKIIALLITLQLTTLVAHDNFNQISANVGANGVDSSHLRFNHQSYFYIPNGDAFILDLAHSLCRNHIQNEAGLSYRTFAGNVGLGANIYYMNMNHPGDFLHQLSPGIEAMYKDLHVAYNLYLPTSQNKKARNGMIYHNPVSEFGLRYMIRKDIGIALLPFIDHKDKSWGLNSRLNYTLNDRFEFGIAPYFKKEGKGCLFSFGINFGESKGMKQALRSNAFKYSLKHFQPKIAKIYVQMPIIPIVVPDIEYPELKLIEEDETLTENIEQEELEVIAPIENHSVLYHEMIEEIKEPEKKPETWFNFFPFRDIKRSEVNLSAMRKDDFFLVAPWGKILNPNVHTPGDLPGMLV